MHKIYQTSVFIFRRDLRLQDNSALIAALEKSHEVIPCFILDPRQVTEKNQYRSMRSIQFMLESLTDLAGQLALKNAKLVILYGEQEKVLAELAREIAIDAVFVNRDYTPFSTHRDAQIEAVCVKNNLAFEVYGDYLLHEPEEIFTKSGTPYLVFTAFYMNALTRVVRHPKSNEYKNYYTGPVSLAQNPEIIFKTILPVPLPKAYTVGGSHEAQKIVHALKNFKNYSTEHNFPTFETTHLSAHNKFGTVSIREVYHAMANTLGLGHPLIRQLYWRDFFTHIAFRYPRIFMGPFHEKYTMIQWNTNQEMFERWCTGTTGFPIVDAGMRQLNETGFMHNRVRLIVGSFLVKDLHINWQWGERYFAQKLVDYDPCVNNGNWQWVASTGCDAAPYFRIFNPWLQQKKFDPECEYIKKWIPHLRNVPIADIHAWYKKSNKAIYYAPMIDHGREVVITKQMYHIKGEYIF